jgi:hypothetical protein
MKIEKQVCSLEQAKKLKELGVKQEISLYAFNQWNYKVMGDTSSGVWQLENKHQSDSFYSAFTVAELGDLLGYLITKKRLEVPDEITERYARNEDDYTALYSPNLLSDTIIYWLENNLVAIEEVNQRLISE